MATETAVKARPDNLAPLAAPEGKCPHKLKGTDEAAVTDWAEMCRDYYEERGQRLTPRGLMTFTRGIEDKETRKAVNRVIKSVYADEYKAEEAGNAAPPAKTTKKEKAVKKNKAKAKAAAKPSANGHAKKADKPAKAKAPAAEPQVLLEATVKGVPVKVTGDPSPGGRKRTTAFGKPIREWLKVMGAKGLSVEDAKAVCNTLYAKLGDEDYVNGFCEEGRVGSGARGAEGAFGPVPNYPKSEVQVIIALAPAKKAKVKK